MNPLSRAPPTESLNRPTRIRYRVVAVAVALAMVTYLDRVCISKLAPDIRRDLDLTMVQMGYVFSAFSLAYAFFEIPTAWWADRVGTRTVLARIVVWWSVFTIATGAAFNYASLLVTRFLFGLGEAGAWPCVARTFSRWIPARERGTIQGIFFSGAHLAGGVTPLLVVALLPYLHWRMVFVCFGAVGFAWAAGWYLWFRDDPAQHPAVNAAELEQIQAERKSWGPSSLIVSRQVFRPLNVIALCVMYLPNSSMFYFCITWLPTYLHDKHGFDAATLGFLSGLPLLLSVASDLCGGLVTDWVARRYGLRAGRCVVSAVAYSIAGIAVFGAIASGNPVLAALLLAFATAACMFTLGAAWGTCIEVGREHAGVVSASMNTSGQVGSVLSPLVVAYSVEWFGSWNLPLYLMGFLFLIGAVCWLIIDPEQPVFAAREIGETH